MKYLAGILILFFSAWSLASDKKHQHHEQGAHIHGTGKLAIAFDGNKGKVEFKSAAESVLGFEHRPKNKKDEKVVAEAVVLFEKQIAQMVQFSPTLKCQFSKEFIGQVAEAGEEGSGEHSDWAANFNMTCAQAVLGSSLVIDFSKIKDLRDVDITVLVGDLQKSAEFKIKPVRIELK